MDPSRRRGERRDRKRLPRTRGDGPLIAGAWLSKLRSWGSPAHAGMDRRCSPAASSHAAVRAPPHTRGWTPSPAVRRSTGLPRTRGDGPLPDYRATTTAAPPHTRGWTPAGVLHRDAGPGSPAHAGMDPRSRRSRACGPRLPRTRGDGPDQDEFEYEEGLAPPHTRGWTVLDSANAVQNRLPRTRGDGPLQSPGRPRPGRLPRTRGDGPLTTRMAASDAVGGSPAHAGMDP